MARELRRWGVALVGALLIILVAGLQEPPAPGRSANPTSNSDRWALETVRLEQAWRGAFDRARLEHYRSVLEPLADSARRAGGTAPILLIDGPSTAAQRTRIQAELAGMWRAANPEGFKVAVGLVLLPDSGADYRPPIDHPTLTRPWFAEYLFPDSAHRGICVAVFPTRRLDSGAGPFHTGLDDGLGPCAFYGAFGSPGPEIARWLRGQGLKFAMFPHWWESGAKRDPRLLDNLATMNSVEPYFYSEFTTDGVACYARQRARCLRAVFDSGAIADSAPVTWRAEFWWKGQPFVGTRSLLSDVVHDLGPERFSNFWTSDLPVDSAFHLAADTSLADWTESWAALTGPSLRVGRATYLGRIPPIVLVAGLSLGAALWYARRRQIG